MLDSVALNTFTPRFAGVSAGLATAFRAFAATATGVCARLTGFTGLLARLTFLPSVCSGVQADIRTWLVAAVATRLAAFAQGAVLALAFGTSFCATFGIAFAALIAALAFWTTFWSGVRTTVATSF